MQYQAPANDLRFLLFDVLGADKLHELEKYADATPDLISAVIDEAGKLAAEVIQPTNQVGDRQGCSYDPETKLVKTPDGFKEAYQKFVEGGWTALDAPLEYGGQGLPHTLKFVVDEMVCSTNLSLGMYPGLTHGAISALHAHGSDELKKIYLEKLISGEWTGTMCLTEPQCGTDLGQVKTKAEPQADGSYRLTGTKIFISSGDHDLTENIVHIVLARLPDAPKGTRGISLFIVPKFLPDSHGGVGERNAVVCGSLEKKMGIKASATCVLNFDGATGYLIGPENEGLNCMFTFMNTARIGTAIQGVGPAELSYQWALAYAKDRRSMRALSGKKEPDQVADSLIHHADVRRMLLTQKAIAEGGRAMLYYAARLADHMVEGFTEGDKKKAEKYDDKLGFLTPILKGFLTELGCEAANLGVQVFGGHGYIREHGMEQIVRDTRIATLYEGTTGIQALDLLGRKVLLMTQGGAVREFTLKIANFARKHLADKRLRPWALELLKLTGQWNLLTVRIMLAARKDRDVVSSAAYDFLMYSGYVTMAYIWLRQAAVAVDKLDNGGEESEGFYRAKLGTTEFYFERLLPRAQSHAASMLSPSKNLMQLDAEDLAFTG